MTRGWLGTGVALLVLAAGCGGGGGGEDAAATPRVEVGTALAQTDTLTDVVTLVGRLAPTPGGSALLTAPAPAVVKRIDVQIGTRVARGTPLLELEAPELETNARTLTAQADIAERDAARQKELLRQGITSQRQADQKAAEATGARAAATAAAQLLARARVTSPIAGSVQRVLVHPGERVDAGTPLVEVIDGSTLDLLAPVPATDLPRLWVGALAVVIADGTLGTVPGRVQAVAPAVDSLTNAGQAVIRVRNAGGTLHPGAGATAIVVVGSKHQSVVVSDSALVVVGDSLTVFVVGPDSVAKARSVAVGVRRGGRAEILRGLAAGERVVVSGAFGLSDGTKVVP